MTSALTTPRARNWQLYRKEHKNTYALALLHLNKVDPSVKSRLSELGGGKTEFRFSMNPKTMDLEEPMAVVIKPTQGGGQYIEHQGQIYKNIHITGTTGLRPNPKKFIGVAFQDGKRGLPAGERTGFDDLIDLRNIFRTYGMAKKDPELASSVIMVWKNGKEGEYFVVEPISFRTGRDSSSPLTATYDIQLRTISRYEEETVRLIKDSRLSRRSPAKSRFLVNAAIQSLADSINTLNAATDAALSASARTLTDILRPTNELFSALATLANTTQRTLEIPRSALNTLSGNIMSAISEISETVVLAGSYDKQKSDILGAYRNIRRAVTSVLAQDELFTSSNSEILNTKKAQLISDVFGEVDSGGDLTSLSNEAMGEGVGQAVVGAGDNIRKLAKRLLGASARWKALVLANGLKAPYVSKDGDGKDVLRPGDFILFPTVGAVARTGVVSETVGKNRTLSPIEERLGRDIKITSPTSAGGVTQFDFTVGDNGDIALVEGVENMTQAVRIKFETEQGELPMHPFFGIRFPLGVKVAAVDGFIEFDVNARSTLLSDPRIDIIRSLDIEFVGNVLDIKGDVLVKGFDSALAFSFSTKR